MRCPRRIARGKWLSGPARLVQAFAAWRLQALDAGRPRLKGVQRCPSVRGHRSRGEGYRETRRERIVPCAGPRGQLLTGASRSLGRVAAH